MVSATISFCIDEEAVAQRGQVKCARLNSLVKEKPILDRSEKENRYSNTYYKTFS